jgi:riboflavin kinase / FMN adenylyltransferase
VKCMQEGQSENMLPVVFTGVVVKGRGMGRGLGYPTANVIGKSGQLPNIAYGVYAGWADVAGKRYKSIMSFGKAETVGATTATFEVHLLDFQGDLYGKELEVAIVIFLRGMVKFNSALQLIEAMKEDERKAREIIEKQ